MITYKVRSRDLVDIANDINSGSIILSPFFQRKLVWRLAHKVDFIKTILLGYPFPEIFISRGTLDVETMKSTSCVVDGQQRMSAIKDFIGGRFDVDGKRYSDLSPAQKGDFLKYEIAIIDLDLPQDDPQIIEIFKRLNRTFYALSNIEKLATEYGSSEFMLVAKLLCGELRDDEEDTAKHNVDPALPKSDPNITEEFVEWGNRQRIKDYLNVILGGPTFSKYEVARQVHLMFTLNLMSTLLVGIYARNEQVVPHLDTYADNFDKRDEVVQRIDRSAAFFNRLRLPTHSPWFSKSNAFSLLVAIDSEYEGIAHTSARKLKEKLMSFMDAVPDDYALAAREAVNNKRQRGLRDNYVRKILSETTT